MWRLQSDWCQEGNGEHMPAVNRAAPARTAQRQHALGRLVCSQSRPVRLVRWILAVLAIVLALAQLRAAVRTLLPQRIYDKDFLQGYILARATLDRADPYLPTDVLAERYVGAGANPAFTHPTPHPPTLGLLLLPLALLDYSTAAVLWFGLEALCLVASAYLLARAIDAQLPIQAALGITVALLVWYPFPIEMSFGQVQVPLLALLAASWVALRAKRWALGGALVGLAILLKPVPWPLLLWFVSRRDWRALRAALLVLAGGYLLAGCLAGWDTLATYFATVLPLVASTYRSSWGNLSLSSLAWRLLHGTEESGTVLAAPLLRSTAAAEVASVALPVVLLLVACAAVRKDDDLDVSLGLMAAVSILTSPIAWAHYLVLAAIPVVHVLRWLERHGWPSKETNVALVVAVLLSVNWVGVGALLALQWAVARQTMTLPFALAQIPLMTTVAVGALAWLVAWLGPVEKRPPAAVGS